MSGDDLPGTWSWPRHPPATLMDELPARPGNGERTDVGVAGCGPDRIPAPDRRGHGVGHRVDEPLRAGEVPAGGPVAAAAGSVRIAAGTTCRRRSAAASRDAARYRLLTGDVGARRARAEWLRRPTAPIPFRPPYEGPETTSRSDGSTRRRTRGTAHGGGHALGRDRAYRPRCLRVPLSSGPRQAPVVLATGTGWSSPGRSCPGRSKARRCHGPVIGGAGDDARAASIAATPHESASPARARSPSRSVRCTRIPPGPATATDAAPGGRRCCRRRPIRARAGRRSRPGTPGPRRRCRGAAP